jgi:hypothetical protein
MQAQNRLVSFPARPLVLGSTLVVVAVLFVAVLFSGVVHNVRTTTTSPHIAVLSSTPDNQPPDARERNDNYSQAMAQRFVNQSPDAQERNAKLSGSGQTLSRNRGR